MSHEYIEIEYQHLTVKMNPPFAVCRVLPALERLTCCSSTSQSFPVWWPLCKCRFPASSLALEGTALILPWHFLLLCVLRSHVTTFPIVKMLTALRTPPCLCYTLLLTLTHSPQALSVLATLACVIVFQASYTLASLARATTYWPVPTQLFWLKDPAVGSRPWWVLKSGGYSWCW